MPPLVVATRAYTFSKRTRTHIQAAAFDVSALRLFSLLEKSLHMVAFEPIRITHAIYGGTISDT